MDKKDNLSVFVDNTSMSEIFKTEKGAVIIGAWSRDVGTMECRLRLAVVYLDGGVTPVREYKKSKLTDKKCLCDLADLDGIRAVEIGPIYNAVVEKAAQLQVQVDCDGKLPMSEVRRVLSEYVEQYEEPGRVFARDGYGNILASYLQTVIDKLELGYNRMELQKNFKAWGLLRTNQGTGHVYSYKINTGSANDWYFSFKLQTESEAA